MSFGGGAGGLRVNTLLDRLTSGALFSDPNIGDLGRSLVIVSVLSPPSLPRSFETSLSPKSSGRKASGAVWKLIGGTTSFGCLGSLYPLALAGLNTTGSDNSRPGWDDFCLTLIGLAVFVSAVEDWLMLV